MSVSTSSPDQEASDAPPFIEHRDALTEFLGNVDNEGQVVRTRLRASDRVIARVTDGIYRQPGSALRELISSAWDEGCVPKLGVLCGIRVQERRCSPRRAFGHDRSRTRCRVMAR